MDRSRLHAVRLLILAAALMCSLLASAGTLDASFTETSGRPIQDLRIEVIGPTKRTLFTGEQGRVRLELPGGSYVLRISDRDRKVDFDLRVPEQGKVSPSFELEW
jgi:hypothetical protein